MFIETETRNGFTRFINIQQVRSVMEDGNGGWDFHMASPRDEEPPISAKISKSELRTAILESNTFPAQPGYKRLDLHYGEDGSHHVEAHPVIAWRPDTFGNLEPICVDNNTRPKFTAVMYPDGRVVDAIDERVFYTAGEWEAHYIEHLRRYSKAAA
ncbi:hypothetical protein ACLMJV_06845 [Sinorhizobium meliloti]|uniref:hypothetical protein n=1 Tax=Rhizobium meliloti TaxID=382 RepID=UPI00398D2E10